MKIKKQNKFKLKQPSIAFSIIILIFALCCQMLSMKANANYLDKLEPDDRNKYQECFKKYKNLVDKTNIQHTCFCVASEDRQNRTIDAIGLVFEILLPSGNVATYDITHKDFIHLIGNKDVGCFVVGPTFATTTEKCENYDYFAQVGGSVFPYGLKDLDKRICSEYNNK